ncbi:MAG: putative glycoside hydrolase [Gaiellaceae bacterium]
MVLGATALSAGPAVAAPATGLIRLDGDIGGVHDAGRYSYVILNAWEANRIAALKAANPTVKVLVYKDMSSTRSYAVHAGQDDSLLPTGVGYAAAEQAHPEWFLRDTHGDRVEWAGYDDHWWMDVGSASYQAAWLAAVQGEAMRNGWDGVFVDNALADPQWYLGGHTLARYPSASTYARATRSFLAAVGPALVAEGLVVLPNISDVSPEIWADWIHFTSGGVKEHWMKYAAAGSWFADWGFNYMQALLDATEQQEKIFIGITASTADDVHSMRYARASFLVGWDGGASALVYTAGKSVDPWSDEWTSDVGRPAATRVKVGASAYRRDYTGGTALVNTSETAAQTFQLARSYVTPEGAPVTSITVQPRSGIVLRLPPAVVDFRAGPSATPSTGSPPAVTPAKRPKSKAEPGAAKPKRISLRVGRVLQGRVHAHGTWRVTVYWQQHSRWRLFARTPTDASGVFRLAKPVPTGQAVRMRAVARAGREWANSRVIRVSSAS